MPPIFHTLRRPTGWMWIASYWRFSVFFYCRHRTDLSSSGCALSLLAGLACVPVVNDDDTRTSGLSRSSGLNTVTNCSVASLAIQSSALQPTTLGCGSVCSFVQPSPIHGRGARPSPPCRGSACEFLDILFRQKIYTLLELVLVLVPLLLAAVGVEADEDGCCCWLLRC